MNLTIVSYDKSFLLSIKNDVGTETTRLDILLIPFVFIFFDYIFLIKILTSFANKTYNFYVL